MILGKVVGTIVTTISHPHYKNRRLLVVQPLTLPGDPPQGDFVALDNTHAGIGDTVLVNREGNAARQVLEEKLVKRKVSLKSLDWGKVTDAAGGTVRQSAALQAGISSDKAREINRAIKDLGLKGISSQTQGEQVRVTGKKRDDLQEVIAALRDQDLGIPLQFENFRD